MTYTLDARNLICPLPVLKARKILLGLPQGAVLTVHVTDPQSPKDFKLFCEENNYTLKSSESIDNWFEVVIIKT